MSKQNIANNVQYNEALPQGFRTMTPIKAMQLDGRNINPETGTLFQQVEITFRDTATGQDIRQQYNLDKPGVLNELLQAIADSSTEPEVTLEELQDIDWEIAEDVRLALGTPVIAWVVTEEYRGRNTNSIGRVKPFQA